LEPRFAENVQSLTDWHQVSLLSVASNRCRRWYKPGLLLIGDAAHTMTPAAGSGIKYAIDDAVEAANVLTGPLLAGRLRLADLREVQRRREWPTRFIQAFGAGGLRRIGSLLRTGRPTPLPRLTAWLLRLPFVTRLLANLLAFGLWRVRVNN
jgi:2-polyprenyl-6-methoxyphenol hydroxylase-like FAD-dependent oxidoreductase